MTVTTSPPVPRRGDEIVGLRWIKDRTPELYAGYGAMIAGLRENLVFSEKELQLHTLSVLTAKQLSRGVGIHVRYALDAGATEDEVFAAIVVCFATCGIGAVVEALDEALLAMGRSGAGDVR